MTNESPRRVDERIRVRRLSRHAGLVPASTSFLTVLQLSKTWMAGTSPAKTNESPRRVDERIRVRRLSRHAGLVPASTSFLTVLQL
ncbi:MAG TPA: hypothetical protein VFP60_14040, partial [Pseudolabrys sp.]|nr:hypothetical protein [Pseudolabrys sp.]